MSLAKPPKFHELRVSAASPTSGARLRLDGLELKGVTNFQLSQSVGAAMRLELTLYVETVNSDAEALRKLLEDV